MVDVLAAMVSTVQVERVRSTGVKRHPRREHLIHRKKT